VTRYEQLLLEYDRLKQRHDDAIRRWQSVIQQFKQEPTSQRWRQVKRANAIQLHAAKAVAKLRRKCERLRLIDTKSVDHPSAET